MKIIIGRANRDVLPALELHAGGFGATHVSWMEPAVFACRATATSRAGRAGFRLRLMESSTVQVCRLTKLWVWGGRYRARDGVPGLKRGLTCIHFDQRSVSVGVEKIGIKKGMFNFIGKMIDTFFLERGWELGIWESVSPITA